MNNIKELIPKNKFDIEAVNKLSDREPEEIIEIISDLMMWLQDINWPVAIKLSKVLAKCEDILLPYIRDILKGSDEQWKYSLLTFLIRELPKESQYKLIEDINRIISAPTLDEQLEGTDLLAKETLEFFEKI